MIRFHYFSDHTGPHPRPLVTVCRVYDGWRYGYGWAITSPRDNPCKRTGRRIAEERARAALAGHGTQGAQALWDTWFYERPIQRYEAVQTLARCGVSTGTLITSLPPSMLAREKE